MGEGFRFVAPGRKGLEALRERLGGEPEAHLYLLSRLERALEGGEARGRFFLLLDGEDALRGGLYLGREKNLAVSDLPEEALGVFVKTVLARGRGVQVAVSPKPEIDALAEGLAAFVSPLLHRTQVLYVLDREGRPGPRAEDLVPAGEEDLDWLARAGYRLAREDLGIPAWALNRERLRRLARKRIRRGKTFVIRRERRAVFKANLAAACREGVVIEGVYTDKAYRGRGLASRGVAALAADLLERYPRVALHVGEENLPARRAYEKAGFRAVGRLGIFLCLPW